MGWDLHGGPGNAAAVLAELNSQGDSLKSVASGIWNAIDGTVTAEVADAAKGGEKMTARVQGEGDADGRFNFLPAMKSAEEQVSLGLAANIVRSMTPEGISYPPLSPRTVRRKGHSKQLIDSGRLLQSLIGGGDHIANILPNQLESGTRVPYGAIHEFGTARIPARSFLGIDEPCVDRVIDTLVDSLISQLLR